MFLPAYDALNHRVRTVVGSTTTEYLFNKDGQRVSVWNGSTRTVLRGQYCWGSKPVGYYVSGAAAHFQHQDWLGTERLRTTYNGAVEGSYTSLPFGDAQTPTGTDTDAYHFAQLDSDGESGTDHAQFRQYNSTQGRWMRPDPYSGSYDVSNPQSMNRYEYADNNPGANSDPEGLVTTSQSLPPGVNTGPGCIPCLENPFLAYNAGIVGTNGSFFGNISNEFGTFTSTWVPGHEVPFGPYVPGHWQYYFIIFDFSSDAPMLTAQLNAPSNGPPSIGRKIVKVVCGSSPGGAIIKQMVTGSMRGLITGGIVGATGGSIFAGVGAIPGALMGGFIGGVTGAAGGVITGGAIAAGCSLGGVYQ